MTNKRFWLGSAVLAFVIVVTGCAHRIGGSNTGSDGNELFNKVLINSNPKIRVATYNILAGAGNLNLIAEAIQKINPDIIALQEVDRNTQRNTDDQIAVLSKLTGYQYSYGKTMDFQGGEYGIAVLSKYPILDSEIVKLPYTNTLTQKEEEPRIALVTHVDVPGFDVPITFINTHLDWQEDPNIRLQQVRTINQFTENVRGIKILAGDFNDTLNSVIGKEMERYWVTVFNGTVDHRTWPAINPQIAIDHIFLNKTQVWKVEKIYVPNVGNEKDADWKKISDHIPVIADLTLLEY
jgi:endonuclease/exonuclease/phosphatase family metal-dependent hydrolase